MLDTPQYCRTIESMGHSLALIQVESQVKPVGLFFHFLFERGKKPSLDIAIDPHNGTIIYVNMVLQDEMIVHLGDSPTIELCRNLLRLPLEEINEKNYHYFIPADFIIAAQKNDLWILRKDYHASTFGCYLIDSDNGLLFDQDEFIGLFLRNLSPIEIKALNSSEYWLE